MGYKKIRDIFLTDFYKTYEYQQIKNELEEIKEPFDESEIIVTWRDNKNMRIFHLQESAYVNGIEFDVCIDKKKLNLEYDNLTIITINTDKKVDKILSLFKLWFIELTPLYKMKKILKEYNSVG